MSTARIVNGIKHGRACACPVCDPEQTKLAAARAAAKLSRAVPVKVVSTPEGPAVLARRMPRYLPPSAQTRRMAELLREGKTAAQAIEIIDSTPTNEDPNP
jgi:hypothetical protein